MSPSPDSTDLDGYLAHDLRRRFDELPKFAADEGGDARSAFARDRARVLHSAALRRLAGKTQVVGPEEGDVPRTRLTHSLEVAQIGRGIAGALGADPDVVDMAGLAHDIGHPPFGHNGERALDELAAGIGGFEGNAQTLRILTRLEPKVAEPAEVWHGLNLTRACLDAATKYPWPKRAEQTKFGVYADDLAAFEWMRDGAPERRRCLEAQIVDWSDDVAYSVHDLEDGVVSGRISLRSLADADERVEIVRMAGERFWPGGSDRDPGVLEEAVDRLLRLPVLAAALDFDGGFTAQVALKRLTSELVGRFVAEAVSGTRERFGSGVLTRYSAELVVGAPIAAEVAVLKAVALRYVMSDPRRLRMQREQRALLTELFRALVAGAPDSLDPAAGEAWSRADDPDAQLRAVVDQVASLTDAQAIAWHRRFVLSETRKM